MACENISVSHINNNLKDFSSADVRTFVDGYVHFNPNCFRDIDAKHLSSRNLIKTYGNLIKKIMYCMGKRIKYIYDIYIINCINVILIKY